MNITIKYERFGSHRVTLRIPVFLDVTQCLLVGSFWCFK